MQKESTITFISDLLTSKHKYIEIIRLRQQNVNIMQQPQILNDAEPLVLLTLAVGLLLLKIEYLPTHVNHETQL